MKLISSNAIFRAVRNCACEMSRQSHFSRVAGLFDTIVWWRETQTALRILETESDWRKMTGIRRTRPRFSGAALQSLRDSAPLNIAAKASATHAAPHHVPTLADNACHIPTFNRR
jgi:hypothetical protein